MTHSLTAFLSHLMSRISLQKNSKIMQKEKFSLLSNNSLKVIAMVSMLTDHMGLVLFPHIRIFRIIGRLAFPIFAYMIAEGCFYTKDRRRYLLLIAAMGFGCQAVYLLTSASFHMNILLTFTLSICAIFSADNFFRKKDGKSLLIFILVWLSVIFLCAIAPELFSTYGFRFDYGFLGVFLPVAVYFPKKKSLKILFTAIVLLGMTYLNQAQIYSLCAVPLLMLYNGKRGKLNMKYVFYIFYPAHLAVIYLIDKFI